MDENNNSSENHLFLMNFSLVFHVLVTKLLMKFEVFILEQN